MPIIDSESFPQTNTHFENAISAAEKVKEDQSMSSAGRVPAWVIRRLTFGDGAPAAKRRKNFLTADCSHVPTDSGEITGLVSSGQSAWASDEMEAIYEVLSKQKSIDEGT